MRLLKRFQEVSDIRRLKRQVEEEASPQAALALCRALQRQGQATEALECARAGLSRFPYSTELKDVLRSTWKREMADATEALRTSTRRESTPSAWARLVEAYLEWDELELASLAVEEMIERYPDKSQSFRLQSQVHLVRFYRDHVAEDGAVALRALQRTLEIDSDATESRLVLVEAYAYIGAYSKALFHLYKVLDAYPDHEEGKRLFEVLSRLPLEREGEEELLRKVEESDLGGISERTGDVAHLDEDLEVDIDEALGELALRDGVLRCALHHHGVDRVAAGEDLRVMEDEARDPFADLAVGFRQAASLSAKRMGIGAFREAELRFESGRVHAFAGRTTVMVLEVDRRGMGEELRTEASSLIAACLPAPKEGSSV